MSILKAENAINVCKQHIINQPDQNSEIEYYLTNYLLILISSSFEEEFERLFIERAKRSQDPWVISYFEKEIPNLLKSVGIGKLSEFIGKFGTQYKQQFVDKVSTQSIATYYSLLITNRHNVAHETSTVTVTLNETINAFYQSKQIISIVEEILHS